MIASRALHAYQREECQGLHTHQEHHTATWLLLLEYSTLKHGSQSSPESPAAMLCHVEESCVHAGIACT